MLKKDAGLLLFLTVVGIVVFLFVEAIHDYLPYIQMWNRINGGEGPWDGLIAGYPDENAYGPLFVGFTIPWAIQYRLPRLIFWLSWIAGTVYLLRIGYQMRSPWVENRLWKWTIFANPSVIIFSGIFGQLDVLLAMVCAVAVAQWHRNKELSGGLWLAAAIGTKFYPVILLGAAARRMTRMRILFPVTVVVAVAAIFAIAYAIWGDTCFAPLTFAADRESKKYSIFRFLRGSYSPLMMFSEAQNFDRYSGLLLAGSLVVVTIASWWYRWRVPFTSLLLAWCVVLFYKVGHENLYFWTLPLAFYLVLYRGDDQRTRDFVKAFSCFWGWLSLMAVIYYPTRFEGPFRDLRDWLALPTFALAIWVLVTLLKLAPTEVETEAEANGELQLVEGAAVLKPDEKTDTKQDKSNRKRAEKIQSKSKPGNKPKRRRKRK